MCIHQYLSVLDLSKILIYQFQFDYIIPKWSKKTLIFYTWIRAV